MAAAAVPRKSRSSPIPAPPKPMRSRAMPKPMSTITRVVSRRCGRAGSFVERKIVAAMATSAMRRSSSTGLSESVEQADDDAERGDRRADADEPCREGHRHRERQLHRLAALVRAWCRRSPGCRAGGRRGRGRRPLLHARRFVRRRHDVAVIILVALVAIGGLPGVGVVRPAPQEPRPVRRGAARCGSGQAGAAGRPISLSSSIGWPQVGQKIAVSSTSVPQLAQARRTFVSCDRSGSACR